jgi:hypothetical protein
VQEDRRVAATGCECGLLQVAAVSLATGELLALHRLEFDGPLTCARLFRVEAEPQPAPACLPRPCQAPPARPSPLHLCVTYSLGSSKVFHDVLNNGLSDSVKLPNSNRHDCTTCVCVADLDHSGRQRLLLGTYGQVTVEAVPE